MQDNSTTVMKKFSDEDHTHGFSIFHEQTAQIESPFDSWFENEVQRIHKMIEDSQQKLHTGIGWTELVLQVLSRDNVDVAEALDFLNDDNCPGEKVYLGKTTGTPIQIMLYNHIDHPLWRKTERAKAVAFWALLKIRSEYETTCQVHRDKRDQLAKDYIAAHKEANHMEEQLGWEITPGPLREREQEDTSQTEPANTQLKQPTVLEALWDLWQRPGTFHETWDFICTNPWFVQ